MITDEEVVNAFVRWWRDIGGTSDAFNDLKNRIFLALIELELEDEKSRPTIPMDSDHPLPPFSDN